MDIKEAYEELKAIVPKDKYISVSHTLDRFANGNEEVEYTVYINEVGVFPASTIERALDLTKERLQEIEEGGENMDKLPIMEKFKDLFYKMADIIKVADELHEEATPIGTLDNPKEYAISADVLGRLEVARQELLKIVRKAMEE